MKQKKLHVFHFSCQFGLLLVGYSDNGLLILPWRVPHVRVKSRLTALDLSLKLPVILPFPGSEFIFFVKYSPTSSSVGQDGEWWISREWLKLCLCPACGVLVLRIFGAGWRIP